MISSAKTFTALALSIQLLSVPYPLGQHHNQVWHRPIQNSFEVISNYSLPHGKYRAGHRGIDVQASSDDPVLAAQNGTVVFAGLVVDREVITIAISNELLVTYEPVASDLLKGDAVLTGQQLGTVPSGGHCASQCVHIGVRKHKEYVNPLRYFLPKPRLLPQGTNLSYSPMPQREGLPDHRVASAT